MTVEAQAESRIEAVTSVTAAEKAGEDLSDIGNFLRCGKFPQG
ncbi:hypothetical protein Agau_C100409 [Agrobacterium tumefaciens F2]|nr:hypothetical protein Agau_C100409 [Agrobacterium tumefaciens F2]